MKYYFLLVVFILSCTAGARDSFITNMEYAKMLYKNPRGIGCNKCHGLKGEGRTIAKYKKNGKYEKLKAPQINNLDKVRFFKSFMEKHKIMPKYFLTYKEINALYFYIQHFKKRKNNANKKIR